MEERTDRQTDGQTAAATHPVLGVDLGAAVDQVFGALTVTCPHSHVQRRAAQLRGRSQKLTTNIVSVVYNSVSLVGDCADLMAL